MRSLILVVLLHLFVLRFSENLFAQSDSISIKANDQLIKILNKNARIPREIVDKKIAAIFSLKLTLSKDGKVRATASKYFPEKMNPQLTNTEIYKNVTWEGISKRKIKDDDIIIIPFVIYNNMENNSTFYEYTMEDLFLYPDDNTTLTDCVIMQTFVIKYGPAKT